MKITEPALNIDQTAGNTLIATAETGVIDITVTDPAIFAGTYQADTTDLTGGPVNLVAPAFSGTPAKGRILTGSDGLWIFDAEAAPAIQSWSGSARAVI